MYSTPNHDYFTTADLLLMRENYTPFIKKHTKHVDKVLRKMGR
jgi:hypothetical protein